MTRITITALIVFLLDQSSKFAVLNWLQLDHVRSIDVWAPWLRFRMAWNQGVNFGLFSGETDLTRWILILVSLGISTWLLLWARRGGPGAQIWGGLIIGGALGNVIDRLLYGAVADFLNLSCCGINNPYSFNIADMAIFMGAFGLVLTSNKQDNNR